jgi:hypothetical protein
VADTVMLVQLFLHYMLLHCVTDGIWYRAMCLEDESSRDKNVIFLDYGNMAYVGKENIRKMIKDYVETPAVAVMCSLQGKQFLIFFFNPLFVTLVLTLA